MLVSSDVLIGVDAQVREVAAVAFGRNGRELGQASVPVPIEERPDGGVEHDAAALWQATARALRSLADRVPDLARRTAALALTGVHGGTVLIDEDGDPVGPALSAEDARAAALVLGWRESGVAAEVEALTGSMLGWSLQSAQLAWLLQQRPEAVEQAASAFDGKDWLYFCATGERAVDPAGAIARFGDLARGGYAQGVLSLLRLEDISRLLPDIVDSLRHQGALRAAAAAATGLWEGTPVVLAPVEPVTAMLSLGADEGAGRTACSVIGAHGLHAQIGAGPPKQAGGLQNRMAVPGSDLWVDSLTSSVGSAGARWLVGLAETLLADTGLIGVGGDELAALLDRRAEQALAGAALFHPFMSGRGEQAPFLEPGARAQLLGLSERTHAYDLMRAIYEGIAFVARDCHAALGAAPDDLRLGGDLAVSRPFRRIIAASLGAPVRRSVRFSPAATGAAMFSEAVLRGGADPPALAEAWVSPYLDDPEPADPGLVERYRALYEDWRRSRRPLPGASEQPPASAGVAGAA